MTNVRTLTRSFGGGEVTPEFFGRIDDVKYQTGLAMCRNFIVLPHGPVSNRPGTTFVREAKDSTKRTRLIPFTYSTTQTFAIELGAGYFRFHTQGATLLAGSPPAYNGATSYVIGDLVSSGGVTYYCIAATTGNAPPNATYWYALPSTAYEIPNPYAEADLFDIHYVQSADVLTLVHPNYPVMELRRVGATNWQLIPVVFVSTLTAPTGPTATPTGTGTVVYAYKIAAVDATGLEESLPSTVALGPAVSITAITKANPGVLTTGAVHNLSIGDPVTVYNAAGMTQINGDWTVNTVPTTTTLTLALNGVPVDTTAFGTYTGSGSISLRGVRNNLLTTGNYNTINWQAVAGAVRYNVYKQSNGLYGYIGQTDGLTFKDDNITSDVAKTPPIQNNPFVGANNYPGAVSYFEQRRTFGGTINKPQNMWMTRSGTESNLSSSIPTNDSDAINFKVFAREANTIRHIVPVQSLILLTSSAEWRVTSINSDAITPTSISVRPQSYVGASNVQPLIINNNILHVAARGGHWREIALTTTAAGNSGYISSDISLRAPHLFDGLDIVDQAFAKAPTPIAWAVSTSGNLLGLTYVPEQQVGAIHRHDTDGVFESVTVVAEGAIDATYVVVRRTINGVSKRYIERFASRMFATQADSFFVDCGGTYNGAPTTTISGLTWLIGKTVNILADGAVHPQRVVNGSGQITLDQAASKVQIGLPIVADIQLLPLAFETEAYGQGRQKNVDKMWLRVNQSLGIKAGPTFDKLVPAKVRTTEPYGSPPALQSREIPIMLKPNWNDSGTVCIRQDEPLPLTIVSMTLEVAIGA